MPGHRPEPGLDVTLRTVRALSLAIDGSRSRQTVVGILFEASVGGALVAASLSRSDAMNSRGRRAAWIIPCP